MSEDGNDVYFALRDGRIGSVNIPTQRGILIKTRSEETTEAHGLVLVGTSLYHSSANAGAIYKTDLSNYASPGATKILVSGLERPRGLVVASAPAGGKKIYFAEEGRGISVAIEDGAGGGFVSPLLALLSLRRIKGRPMPLTQHAPTHPCKLARHNRTTKTQLVRVDSRTRLSFIALDGRLVFWTEHVNGESGRVMRATLKDTGNEVGATSMQELGRSVWPRGVGGRLHGVCVKRSMSWTHPKLTPPRPDPTSPHPDLSRSLSLSPLSLSLSLSLSR